MTRILILMLGALLTLAGCGGGGSDGIEYGQPTVRVMNLTEGSVTVRVGVENHIFMTSDSYRYEKKQNNRSYDVKISGNSACGFTGKHSANNDEPTQTTSSKKASEVFIVSCNFDSNGVPDEGEEGGDPENPIVGSVKLSPLELKDASGQQIGTTDKPIQENRPARVTTKLSQANGASLGNKLVVFEISGPNGVGSLDPISGTTLTDGNGVAAITLGAGQELGAAILRAVYEDGTGKKFTSEVGFTTAGGGEVSELEIALGYLDNSNRFVPNKIQAPTGLKVNSSVAVTATLWDVSNARRYPEAPVEVEFTSRCSFANKAAFSPAKTLTMAGQASVSYESKNGCDEDAITANVTFNGARIQATTDNFAIEQSPPATISFVEAQPGVIGIKGASGAGAEESSTLLFQVKDEFGEPVPAGEKVNFSRQKNLGGFDITSGAVEIVTDEGGFVRVTVKSGTVPGVGTIRAELADRPAIYGSGSVSIQQGVSAQDKFTIAVETLNPAAGNHPGLENKVTARAADRYGNWVPNGTKINFATKLGDIEASCETINGSCSVTWASQGPEMNRFDDERALRDCAPYGAQEWQRRGLPVRPAHMVCGNHDLFGVNVITAWTSGEESFADTDGNNVFDEGESYVDLPEMFQDYNLTGLYQSPVAGIYVGDDYQDRNNNRQHDSENGKYNGLSCSDTDVSCERELVDVRATATMVLSTDHLQLIVYDQLLVPDSVVLIQGQANSVEGWGNGVFLNPANQATNGNSGKLTAVVSDLNGNAPPVGTEIKIEAASDGKIVGPDACRVSNTLNPVACTFNFTGIDTFIITATYEGNSKSMTFVKDQ